jgi:nuclear transport factor 2 (NTF2) superfamily protein
MYSHRNSLPHSSTNNLKTCLLFHHSPTKQPMQRSRRHKTFGTFSESLIPLALASTDLSRDPKVIAQAYTSDSIWRNRSSFIVGTAAIEDLLTKKWEKEKNYRLRKELFAFTDNKIAVQFWYEFQDAHDGMKWKRCYGLEDWTFAGDGKMRKRQMSGNDVEISEAGKC